MDFNLSRSVLLPAWNHSENSLAETLMLSVIWYFPTEKQAGVPQTCQSYKAGTGVYFRVVDTRWLVCLVRAKDGIKGGKWHYGVNPGNPASDDAFLTSTGKMERSAAPPIRGACNA